MYPGEHTIFPAFVPPRQYDPFGHASHPEQRPAPYVPDVHETVHGLGHMVPATPSIDAMHRSLLGS